jgi:predicted nucleotidyltransferase/DNA-binding HxlR family transcriptional regulator
MRAVKRLGDVLFGKARGAILGVLYCRPDDSFYYRQLTRQLADVSTGTLQRELDTLAELGLIARSNIGKQVFYQANRQHPVFGELRALVAKTVGAFDVLRTALAPVAHRIALAFVYGSVAKHEESATSDIDLIIVGEATLEEVLEKLGSAERALARPVNPTIYSVAEFKSKLTSKSHFINSVARGPKVFLSGDEDELRKIVRG